MTAHSGGVLTAPRRRHAANSPVQSSVDVSSAHRRHDVQGLRAIAVLLVVAYHSGLPIPGGFIGVDVFFVISGYVIIALLYRDVQRTGRMDFIGFYTRRIRRILPALAVTSTLTCVAAWFVLNPLGTQQATGKTAIGAALLVANLVIRSASGDYFDESARVNPLLHTWSLSVEEQFYLVFPAIMALAGGYAVRRGVSRRLAVVGVLVALGMVSFAAAWYLTGPGSDGSGRASSWAFYGSPFRVWEFAVGGLIAVAVQHRPRLEEPALRLAGVLGLAMVAVAAFVINDTTAFPGTMTLLPVIGTGLVIYAGTGTVAGVVPGLASRPMTWTGDLSYSWYLWHWPLIIFTGMLFPDAPWLLVVAGFGSLLPSWLSYKYVENPLRHSGLRGVRVVALAAVCVMVPVAAGALLVKAANVPVRAAHAVVAAAPERQVGVPEPAPATHSLLEAAVLAQTGQWTVFQQPCLNGGGRGSFTDCVFFTGAGKPTAVLVGDSHAGAYSPGFLDAANALGYQAQVITTAGCPFSALPIGRDGVLDDGCVKRNQTILARLERHPPDVVVIANRSPRFVSPVVTMSDENSDFQPCIIDTKHGGCLDHASAVRAWSASLDRITSAVQAKGTKILLLQTAPEQLHGLESCVVGRTVRLGCLQTPRELTWDRRVDVISAEQKVARRVGFATYDPFDFFCNATTCRQYVNGQLMYRNDDHLNAAGSEALAPAIEHAMGRLG